MSAEALEVERVGVWLLKDRGTRLVCASLYERSRKQRSSGHELRMSTYPTYGRALQERRAVAADDARTHEYTRELADSYLIPNGITSMLDAPIIHRGKVVGVVCHEHVGAPRKWTDRELEFASAVADMVALVFEQADRLELEAALQHQAEQRLEQQKMEALGRMACAVAHDFNNLLATVKLSLSILTTPSRESDQKVLRDVSSMIEVGRRLTQQLLTFGRGGEDAPATTVDLGQVVRRMEPMLRTAVGRAISFEIEVATAQAKVVAVESQLEQVVLNLCLNARDAIQSGSGQVVVRVRDARDDDDVAADHVVLEVQDTGVGMNEAVSARIFEPFFTTKQAGTGLGLAAVHGIVRRAGGVTRVHSKPGDGTTMLIALPRALSP